MDPLQTLLVRIIVFGLGILAIELFADAKEKRDEAKGFPKPVRIQTYKGLTVLFYLSVILSST